MRRLLYRIPRLGDVLWRRRIAQLHAEQRHWRHEAARHNEAVKRILAQAPSVRDPWRRLKRGRL